MIRVVFLLTIKLVKHTYKSYNIYTINFLKVCLTIYNVTFFCSIFASHGISLCFTERIDELKSTELSYHSCWQHI